MSNWVCKFNRDFILEDNHLVLTEQCKKERWPEFKKITGSMFSEIINDNHYNSSAFIAWCQIVKIYKPDFDNFMLQAGNALEPKIRELASKHLGYNFKYYDSKRGEIFKQIDPVLGGIPDGEPIDDAFNIDYSNNKRMLEIKTSSIDKFKYEKGTYKPILIDEKPVVEKDGEGKNKADWFIGDKFSLDKHKNYIDQLSLYLYLRNQTKGIFAVYFINTKDYENINDVVIKDDDIYYYEFELNRDEFEKKVIKAKEWYKKYVVGGISPELTKKDIKWLEEKGVIN